MRRIAVPLMLLMVAGFLAVPSTAPAQSSSGCSWVRHAFPVDAPFGIDTRTSASGPTDAWVATNEGSPGVAVAYRWDGEQRLDPDKLVYVKKQK